VPAYDVKVTAVILHEEPGGSGSHAAKKIARRAQRLKPCRLWIDFWKAAGAEKRAIKVENLSMKSAGGINDMNPGKLKKPGGYPSA
jgi:hypothetical protein